MIDAGIGGENFDRKGWTLAAHAVARAESGDIADLTEIDNPIQALAVNDEKLVYLKRAVFAVFSYYSQFPPRQPRVGERVRVRPPVAHQRDRLSPALEDRFRTFLHHEFTLQ